MPYIVDRGNIVVVNQNTTHEPPKRERYKMNDLSGTFTHWDPELKRNVPTPNELPNKS